MKKLICSFLIIVLFSAFIFGEDTVPNIKNNAGMVFYLDMPIADVEKMLGTPTKTSELLFTAEKPEYDEIFWEYDSGITLSFDRGWNIVRGIFLESDEYFIEHGDIKLKVGKTAVQDITGILGAGDEYVYDDIFMVEYTFRKKTGSSAYRDTIVFQFIDNVCTVIQIFDNY